MENPLVYTDNNQYYQYYYYYPVYENNRYNSYNCNSNKNTNDKYSYNNVGKKEWNKICKDERYIEIIMNNCHLIEKYNSWKFLVQNKSLYKFDHWENKDALPEMFRKSDESSSWFFDFNSSKMMKRCVRLASKFLLIKLIKYMKNLFCKVLLNKFHAIYL